MTSVLWHISQGGRGFFFILMKPSSIKGFAPQGCFVLLMITYTFHLHSYCLIMITWLLIMNHHVTQSYLCAHELLSCTVNTNWIFPVWNAWNQKCLGFQVVWILEDLNIHSETIGGWEPTLNTKFVFRMYLIYIDWRLFYIMFSSFCLGPVHKVKYGIFHARHYVCAQNMSGFIAFRFLILGLGLTNP